MKRHVGFTKTIANRWHRVVIPNSERAAHATAWAANLPTPGKFCLVTRPDFEKITYVVDCFYFSRKKDAMLFALKWATA